MEYIDPAKEEKEVRKYQFKKNLKKKAVSAVIILAIMIFVCGAAWMAGRFQNKDYIED